MKICHITSVHRYNDTRITLKECRSLVEDNYEVHLIAPNTKETEFNGINVHGITNPYKGRINRVKKFSKEVYLKALEIDADVYHFHDPELIPIGLKLKKQKKVVIYDIHEDVPKQILSKTWIKKPLRKFISVLFKKYENKSVRKFNALITATPNINERFIKLNSKSINVNNYPILSELHTLNSNKKINEPYVTYIGAISKNRGIETMVSAMDLVTNKLYLGGKFASLKEYENVVKKSGWRKVIYLNQLERNEVKDVLNKSIAGLVLFYPEPNHINAQPNKMFEYMSAGVCVIGSDFPLWREIIEGNECGICVNPLNNEEVAKAIQWVIDNPAEAIRMGENGRKAIESKYNWEYESQKLLRLYKELS
ncbi:glycosyltransferase family 4 protein [Halobacillus naozhouensis]|uniref:Glycosyltransferase family 4 protein n=1 Tax=Halobacillus naozhouensis TaxID=554880 RepID=A0ABY8J092_9BACI|nr:glycosyltransferase family 4 protein [Halobacillus naozhouensis]WFT74301.1 glycosyltransferase family 4 protein [Halobacillus naozhouensis]